MEDQDPTEPRGVSRRTIIKTTVGTTAAIWAAPAVTSFGSRAAAAGSLVPQCPEPPVDFKCDAVVNCGTSGPLAQCVCDVDASGKSFCWEDFFCAGAQACSVDSQCPSGWKCVTTCCGTTCAPPCGTTKSDVRVQKTGPTASGR